MGLQGKTAIDTIPVEAAQKEELQPFCLRGCSACIREYKRIKIRRNMSNINSSKKYPGF
ncbi:hypothetical protein LCY76_11860 [Fictibacillus sp. KIGAM418]|uniref:Uncharacterized protein n=1 Tax=Fictibacillus marinisediminis TaxID=2878389 RepID=A0A9X2BD54_9BACL|nr:hypothetical protein [Fictibacillus marinisediminis]MCK6257291.1 hypothetical protein [Fictibacillus marinisediminis]